MCGTVDKYKVGVSSSLVFWNEGVWECVYLMCVSLWLGIIVEFKDIEEKYNKLIVENEDSVVFYYKIR